MNTQVLRILNTLTFAITLFVNYWVNTEGNPGRTVGEISDAYPTLVTPAGYAFSIWALIYCLLIGFVVIQWSPKQPTGFVNRVGFWFILSNLANSGWIFSFLSEQFWLSVLLMLLLLTSLIILAIRLHDLDLNQRWANRLFTRTAIMVYLGWIIAATVVNFSAALVSVRWDGAVLPPEVWAILLVGVATLVYLFLLSQLNAFASAAVGVWALLGITVARDSSAFGVEIAAWAGIIILMGASIALRLIRLRKAR